MSVRIVKLAVVLCLVLFTGSLKADMAKWTFMVYMDGDNNLEAEAVDDFLELASVDTTDPNSDPNDVNFLVLFDRSPSHSTAYGNWTYARRGRVHYGDVPDAKWGASMGELNMGDPQTLVDFVVWGMQSYPANNYAVVLWDHGDGWRISSKSSTKVKSICTDDSNGGDSLSMAEIRQALESIEATTGNPTLIGFDACLMGMMEVAYEVRNHGSVMVGSAPDEPGDGWPYDQIGTELFADPNMTEQSLAATIVDEYMVSYGYEWITQAVFDLTQMNNFGSELDAFSLAMMANWDTDLAACQTAAGDLMQTLDAVILHAQLGASLSNGYGLSAYLPVSTVDPTYTSTVLQLAQNTNWDEFLNAYTTTMNDSWVSTAHSLTPVYDVGLEHYDIYAFCEKVLNASEESPDLFTEMFDSGFDLENKSLTLTPDGSGDYTACIESIIAFPTDPAGGVDVTSPLGGDEFELVTLGSQTVSLYGQTYSEFYICANGYITFGEGDYEYDININNHFSLPRISPLYTDLEPWDGGMVSYRVLGDRVAVTYEDIPEYDTFNSNNFQVEMFTDGTLRISWLQIEASMQLVGISAGTIPDSFVESDISGYVCEGYDLDFLIYFVSRWLDDNCSLDNDCGGADIDISGAVDYDDFRYISEDWSP